MSSASCVGGTKADMRGALAAFAWDYGGQSHELRAVRGSLRAVRGSLSGDNPAIFSSRVDVALLMVGRKEGREGEAKMHDFARPSQVVRRWGTSFEKGAQVRACGYGTYGVGVNLQFEEYWMGFRGSGFILRIRRRRTDGREGSVLA